MRLLAATLLLALATTGWFTLALLPALGELFARTDVEPLQLRRGGGDVRHFALGFGRFVDAQLGALAPAASAVPAAGHAVTLTDGEPAWHIPGGHRAVALPVAAMPAGSLSTHVVLSEEELVVPDGTSLLKELYVARDLRGGLDCFYRAVLALGDISLGMRSGVLRWIDAGGVLVAGEGSVLYGRASASEGMRLMDGVSFQRVAAPTITFGTPEGVGARAGERGARTPIVAGRVAGAPIVHAAFEPPAGVTETFGRWLIDGDCEIPAGTRVDADLIVTGTLRVGEGSRLGGAVKSAVLEGAPGTIYEGAIIATVRLALGAGSEVAGPVVAEGEAWIGADSRVGTVDEPTTISAVSVRMGAGSVVCGEVWARTSGYVEGPAPRRQLSSGGWETIG